MEAVDGIRIGSCPFRREGNKVWTVHLENTAQQIPFRFGERLELLHPCDAVVAVYRFRHERLQGTGLTVEVNDTFLYIGVLFPYLAVNLALGRLGIEGKQTVYEILNVVEALFRSGEVQQLVHRQYPCAVDDGLADMVNQHVTVSRILLAEEDKVNAELGFQFLLQFLLVRAYVPVLFEDAP